MLNTIIKGITRIPYPWQKSSKIVMKVMEDKTSKNESTPTGQINLEDGSSFSSATLCVKNVSKDSCTRDKKLVSSPIVLMIPWGKNEKKYNYHQIKPQFILKSPVLKKMYSWRKSCGADSRKPSCRDISEALIFKAVTNCMFLGFVESKKAMATKRRKLL